MKATVRLREEAGRDLAAAASWYEQQREGLGHEFLDEAFSAFQLVAELPLTYPIVHRDTRRALMTRFPFGIYFRAELSMYCDDQPPVQADDAGTDTGACRGASAARCRTRLGTGLGMA